MTDDELGKAIRLLWARALAHEEFGGRFVCVESYLHAKQPNVVVATQDEEWSGPTFDDAMLAALAGTGGTDGE